MDGVLPADPGAQSECVAGSRASRSQPWGLEAARSNLLKYRENAVFRVAASDGPAIRAARAPRRLSQRCRAATPSSAGCAHCLRMVSTCRSSCRASNGELFDHGGSPGRSGAAPGRPFRLDRRTSSSAASRVRSKAMPSRWQRTFRTIGALAARLHNQAERWTPPPGFTRHAWDTDGLVGEQPFWGRFWELAALSASQRSLLERARSPCAQRAVAPRAQSAQLRADPRGFRARET